jgi:hypothetical protein
MVAISTEDELEITWKYSSVVVLFLCFLCTVLAWLERPLGERGKERSRQYYVFATLMLLATSLGCRGVWMIYKLPEYSPTYPSTAAFTLGMVSRISECLQYSSCVVLCMQWSILCGQILNWPEFKLKTAQRVLIIMNTVFYGFYLGTFKISYRPTSRREISFDRYDDLFISCKCYVAYACFCCICFQLWSKI